MSFVAQVLQPGGGVLLLPLVRLVIGCLMLLTMGAFAAGVARIHMAVLTVLSAGLLVSLSFFESEYKKASMRVQRAEKQTQPTTTTSSSSSSSGRAKTD